MNAEWKTVRLEEITSKVGDGIHGTPSYDDNGEFHFINGNNLENGKIVINNQTKRASRQEYLKYKKELNENTILVSINGTIGNVALYNGENVFLGKSACYLNVKSDINKFFIRYILSSYQFQNYINSLATGSTIKNVSLKLMRNFSFQLPPLYIQNSIAKILGDLDDKIQLNTQINATLEAMAQAIFKSWFVDFDPVKAKMTVLESGGTAEQAELAAMQVISGKDEADLKAMQQNQSEEYAKLAETAALFPSAMQESELGMIPEGWEVGNLSDLIGFNPKRILKKGITAPYLDMKNVPTKGHLADEIILREMSSGSKFINGDTLLARITPCLENGKTAYVDFLEDGQVAWGSTEYIVMRPNVELPTSLGYFIARLNFFRSMAIQTMIGTSGRQRANEKALADLKWTTYPSKILSEFDKIGGGYLKLAKAYGTELKNLAQIRDTMLPKLLSGEIDLAKFNTTEILVDQTA